MFMTLTGSTPGVVLVYCSAPMSLSLFTRRVNTQTCIRDKFRVNGSGEKFQRIITILCLSV